MRSYKLIILIAMLIICVGCNIALAETIPVDSGLAQIEKTELADTIKDILKGIGYFIGVVVAGVLVFSGFQMGTGNEQKRTEAKTRILWALGAVLVVSMAFMIVGYVANLLAK